MANIDTVQALFAVFASGNSSAKKASDLKDLFCDDSNDNWGNPIPVVGITDHDPSFIGKDDILALFQELFASFPSISLDLATLANRTMPPNFPPYLYSDNAYAPPTIGVQATLSTGPFRKKWFPSGNPHHSPPLSDITPNPAHPTQTTLPAALIFNFGGTTATCQYPIMQLSIYTDRYRFLRDLQKGSQQLLRGYDRAVQDQIEWLVGKEKNQ